MQLPYTLDDDHAAIEAVGAEINRPDPALWQAMTTGDDRLRQTYRALGQLLKQVEVAFIKRKSDLRAFRGSRREYHHAAAAYQERPAPQPPDIPQDPAHHAGQPPPPGEGKG